MGFFADAEHNAGGRRLALPPGLMSSAEYGGPQRCYRFRLTRWWEGRQYMRRFVLWIMLNPSVATEGVDDRTLAKCRTLSATWGFGGMVVCNAFPYRSTDPKGLLSAQVPLTTEANMRWIEDAVTDPACGPIVCGWGAQRNPAIRMLLFPEVAKIKKLLNGRGRTLRLTQDGHPQHPLYCKAPKSAEGLHPWPRK